MTVTTGSCSGASSDPVTSSCMTSDRRRGGWGSRCAEGDLARLAAAGADVATPAVVVWPGDTLRRFMVGHVLAHELGHHILQHESRLRGERAARTSDHEARADVIAAELRGRLEWS